MLKKHVITTAVAAAMLMPASLAFADTMTDASNDFTANMLKSISQQKAGENVVVSPSSLSTAFSLVLAGASERDQKLVLQALGYGDASIAAVLADNQKFEASLAKDAGYSVTSTNAMFANTQLDPQYKASIEKSLKAQTQTIDFAKPGASNGINQWADTATKGMIKAIVKDDEISELAFLGLNATLLEAKWAGGKFDSPAYETEFINEQGEEIAKVGLMVSDPEIKIAEAAYSKFTVFEVPYELNAQGEAKGSFMILLPKMLNQREVEESRWSDNKVKPQLVPLNEVLAELSAQSIAQINADLKAKRVAKRVRPLLLNMPKFKVETEVGDELKKFVADLGAGSILTSIDLAAMVAGPAKADWARSKIALIKQKAVIEVAEEGTKAAAVSAIGGFPESCPPPSVDLNRPFAYLVKDGASGRIVFAGTFVAPAK